jgi:hypothetical protein
MARWTTAMAAVLGGLLFACPPTARAGDVVLEIDPASIVPGEAAAETEGAEAPPAAAQVEVSDIRDETALERTTIGHVSLGQINVVPPLPELVGAIVSAKASAIPLEAQPEGEPLVIYCGLRRFSIETPATLLYWDIESRIEILLRVGEEDREVLASAKARTWIYPSKTLLEKVTREALVNLAEQLDPVLRELLLPPSPEEPEAAAEPGVESTREP